MAGLLINVICGKAKIDKIYSTFLENVCSRLCTIEIVNLVSNLKHEVIKLEVVIDKSGLVNTFQKRDDLDGQRVDTYLWKPILHRFEVFI